VAHLVLIGRTESTLRETQQLLAGNVNCSIHAASVTDEQKVREIAEQVGKWDVLVLNAGRISDPAPVAAALLQDWWDDYETNVKSVVIAAQAFIPRAQPGAAFYTVTAGAAVMPPMYTPGLSAYLTSKLAQTKVLEFLSVENPELFFCSVHPGMIDTGIFRGSKADPSSLPMDTGTYLSLGMSRLKIDAYQVAVELPAHFIVWLSSTKNKSFSGKMVWANWDVDELSARSEEIMSSPTMTVGVQGWPFSPAAA
jgi:NAD(P)-dependent dehydrogenase (short-subunit alcohol dehydrogenase family)